MRGINKSAKNITMSRRAKLLSQPVLKTKSYRNNHDAKDVYFPKRLTFIFEVEFLQHVFR